VNWGGTVPVSETEPYSWIFAGSRNPDQPIGRHQVYDCLHAAATAVGLDSEGFGPHTFRRAKITRRQQVGGSAIEASNIPGHSQVQMTSEYTRVAVARQPQHFPAVPRLTVWL
jgi:integrase